jgi:stage V sporulation protein G
VLPLILTGRSPSLRVRFISMKVTNIKIYPPSAESKSERLLCLASVVLDDELQLKGLRVYRGTRGYFVYPGSAEYRQLFYPIKKGLRDHIEEEVLFQAFKDLKIPPIGMSPEDLLGVVESEEYKDIRHLIIRRIKEL